jgi:hypothetical protein
MRVCTGTRCATARDLRDWRRVSNESKMFTEMMMRSVMNEILSVPLPEYVRHTRLLVVEGRLLT